MANFINLDTPFFDNTTGDPLALGTAYFGEPNQDPKTNPKVPYTSLSPNVASTATQSLTSSGKLAARLFLLGDYSLTVDDADGNQQLNYDSLSSSGGVTQEEHQLGSAASSRVFTLSSVNYAIGAGQLKIYRNGVKLRVGASYDYTETSSTSVTLTFDPNTDDTFTFQTASVI